MAESEIRIECGCRYVQGKGIEPCGKHLFDPEKTLAINAVLDRELSRLDAAISELVKESP